MPETGRETGSRPVPRKLTLKPVETSFNLSSSALYQAKSKREIEIEDGVRGVSVFPLTLEAQR